jgi:hypothetical protein
MTLLLFEYHRARKVASMHLSYVSHIHYAFTHLTQTFFHQHRVQQTRDDVQSKAKDSCGTF